jgi:hypothetical protein
VNVFKIHVTDKWRKLSNDEALGASQLQQMFEEAPINFKAYGSAQHGILSNTPQHVGIDRRQGFLKYCHEIFNSLGGTA